MSDTTKPDTPWACPGSHTVLPHDAARAEWLAARREGVGASEFATLLGLAPARWGTPYALWLDKTGQSRPRRAEAVMDKGRDLEPVVLAKFTDATGLGLRRAGMQRSRACPLMQCTPDALADDGSLVEAKLVTRHGRQKWADGVPAMYEWQVRYALAVTGKPLGRLVALDEDSWQLEVHEVRARPGDFDLCRALVAEFWAFVLGGSPPPVDPDAVDAAELVARHRRLLGPGELAEAADPERALADVARYAELSALESQARKAKAEKDLIKARLLLQVGDREYLAVRGEPVARWRQVATARFRERDFKEDHPDLAAGYVDRTPSRRLELLAHTLPASADAP